MTQSPAEFVKSLAPAEQDAVLASLIENMYVDRGWTGTRPLTTAGGRTLGYLLPPDSDLEWAKMLAQMPPEMRENVLKPPPTDIDWDDCLTDEELEEITLRAIAEAQQLEPGELTETTGVGVV